VHRRALRGRVGGIALGVGMERGGAVTRLTFAAQCLAGGVLMLAPIYGLMFLKIAYEVMK
jgi:hypothetical protein